MPTYTYTIAADKGAITPARHAALQAMLPLVSLTITRAKLTVERLNRTTDLLRLDFYSSVRLSSHQTDTLNVTLRLAAGSNAEAEATLS